jgi:hypothetical protein
MVVSTRLGLRNYYNKVVYVNILAYSSSTMPYNTILKRKPC